MVRELIEIKSQMGFRRSPGCICEEKKVDDEPMRKKRNFQNLARLQEENQQRLLTKYGWKIEQKLRRTFLGKFRVERKVYIREILRFTCFPVTTAISTLCGEGDLQLSESFPGIVCSFIRVGLFGQRGNFHLPKKCYRKSGKMFKQLAKAAAQLEAQIRGLHLYYAVEIT